jgi:hypothetical protein
MFILYVLNKFRFSIEPLNFLHVMVSSKRERSTLYYHFIRNTRQKTQYMVPYRKHNSTVLRLVYVSPDDVSMSQNM